jgi:hypothetical protein
LRLDNYSLLDGRFAGRLVRLCLFWSGTVIGTALLGVFLVSCRSSAPHVSMRQLAPGVFYHAVTLIEGPWVIHILEVDLAQSGRAGMRLQTVRAPDGGLTRTSVLASGAVAAINGDFFVADADRPVRTTGVQVSGGEMVRVPQGLSAFALDAGGSPMIGVFGFNAGLIAGGRSFNIDSFNRGPSADGLALYNRFALARTDSVTAALGLQLQSLDGDSVVNDTVRARVVQIRRRTWPLRLDQDQWLVAVGREIEGMRVAPGDTVALFSLMPPAAGTLREAIGGGPRIVRDGGVSVEFAAEKLSRDFAVGRFPRTALGYSRDGNTVFMVVVDGRQPGYSVGMNLEELAHFMCRRLATFTQSNTNAHQALNLDGGGSTTMVVEGGVVNRPSDPTGESGVANALVLSASP